MIFVFLKLFNFLDFNGDGVLSDDEVLDLDENVKK